MIVLSDCLEAGYDDGFDVGGYGIEHHSGYGFGEGDNPLDLCSFSEDGSGYGFGYGAESWDSIELLPMYPTYLILRSAHG
jgi:hypothetical protein